MYQLKGEKFKNSTIKQESDKNSHLDNIKKMRIIEQELYDAQLDKIAFINYHAI